MIKRYIQKLRCFLGKHEYRNIEYWRFFEDVYWQVEPVKHDPQKVLKAVTDAIGLYKGKCIHCKKITSKIRFADEEQQK